MSIKQLGQSTSRAKQLGKSKLTKQLNNQDAVIKDLKTSISTPEINAPIVTSISEVKIEKPETVIASPKQHVNNRFEFYVGKEKMTLRNNDLQRIRELQDANDQLQCQVAIQKRDLLQATDSLKLAAEIEQSTCIIARNAGEILSIHSENEARLRRIGELEDKNINIQQDMTDILGKVTTCHDMHQKTKFAKEYFVKKAEYDRNIAEIQRTK